MAYWLWYELGYGLGYGLWYGLGYGLHLMVWIRARGIISQGVKNGGGVKSRTRSALLVNMAAYPLYSKSKCHYNLTF